jgi:hypothetical protein
MHVHAKRHSPCLATTASSAMRGKMHAQTHQVQPTHLPTRLHDACHQCRAERPSPQMDCKASGTGTGPGLSL